MKSVNHGHEVDGMVGNILEVVDRGDEEREA